MQDNATAEVVGLLRAHGWQSADFAQKLSTATHRSSAESTQNIFLTFFKATSKTNREASLSWGM